MNPNKPASIADIAFETGMIFERKRVIQLLEQQAQEFHTPEGINVNALIDLIRKGPE